MEFIENILAHISNFIWGYPLIIILFGTHIFLTFKLRFIQRYMGKAIKISLGKMKEGAGEISQFGALTTALAATIGTGNIVGVATAVSLGGPGAVLWLWLTGVFGISTKYAEGLLAVKYRVRREDGEIVGGPMYVIEKGMKWKWLAVVFALLTAVSAFGIGNIVQANSIAVMVEETFSAPTYITGLVLAILTAFVILGGIKSIAGVCEKLVPFMAVTYVAGLVWLLAAQYETLPAALSLIFESAFATSSVTGGLVAFGVKEAVRFGIARGLFSNESGLGSAPIVAATAQTKNPVRQALVSASATFWDTVVVCALTGIVIVNSGAYLEPGLEGPAITQTAFQGIPEVGPIILTIALLTFVFSTILGWSYYGEKAAEYLFGSSIIKPYRIAWVVMVMVGSVLSIQVVWRFSEITNALMALPNLISLLVLSGVLVKETRKYLWNDNLDRSPEELPYDADDKKDFLH